VSRRRDPAEPIAPRALDRLLAEELERSFPGAAPDAVALARLASAATGAGHSALDLHDAGQAARMAGGAVAGGAGVA
jgi:hypothetical protein